MSTIDAGHDGHGHDEHDHPPFLAHHFDTPEQQFDSGKLGIWLFLVQEILFFSGMFCAYAIFRSLRPEVFEGCSQFLNTKLGAINTCVLLFSSLTMALAVRCSQVEDNKGLTRSLTATLCCAMIFLGVKAIEYSHKFGMGLLPPAFYFYNPANPHPTVEQMEIALGDNAAWANFFANSLTYFCAPFAVLLVGVFIWMVIAIVRNNKFQADIAKPMFLVCLSFFAGVYLGTILEGGSEEGHASHDTVAHVAHADGDADDSHAVAADHGHATDPAHADHAHTADHTPAAGSDAAEVNSDASGEHPLTEQADAAAVVDDPILELLATDKTNSGVQSRIDALNRQSSVAGSAIVSNNSEVSPPISEVETTVYTKRRAGVFFSIYYCMTGIHAIHIIGGIVVLVWLLVRSVRQDFNKHYFGPVDYVGLYWHLVDLVWIYLFPLLYLIR